MDSQDKNVLDARIRSAYYTQPGLTAERQALLKARLLEKAGSEPILPPTPVIRLRNGLSTAATWLQEGLRWMVVTMLAEDEIFLRAQYQRMPTLSQNPRKRRMERATMEYLEPLKYSMMKISVY
ncbi:MAG: hypothetical protein H6672_22360 [Anaerolineaceae bacterium]|nr:hypothetical protein [Anaerolineaceae bacterium]